MADSLFWKDKAKLQLKDDLFSKTADDEAKKIAQQAGQKFNKYAQLRGFYDEAVKFRTQLLAKKDDKDYFETKLPYIKMLNARLAYAKGRDKISEYCQKFWAERINAISDYADFTAFADFFEAFMAFYKQYKPK
ncbi:MAG: type III-A CRISPR-associated protein Csm2 [Elusimicrobiota bacterium]|jgi:CRISPR-associated protein Csm2|nr:type III-A CRISPR-associated protein Csm2 [Elusimicrobiota bacterium]